jgi:mono/diheme cytochrome c family protein
MHRRHLRTPVQAHVLVVAALAAILASCAPSRAASSAAQSPAATPSPVAADQLAHGEALYRANCQACHGDARTGEGGLPGVPVHGPSGHTWHHSDRNLTEIILDGSGEMGEMMRQMMGTPADAPRMPAWRGKLSEGDVAAILAYIKAGWTPEQRRFQQETPMMR